MDKQTRPGEGSAIASLVLGIISCLTILVYAFSGRLSLGAIAVILGFVGIGAGNAAKTAAIAAVYASLGPSSLGWAPCLAQSSAGSFCLSQCCKNSRKKRTAHGRSFFI